MSKTLEERFWEKVDKSGGPDACWVWTRSLNSQGYGQIRKDGKVILAHRLSWELYKGPIPKGLCVLHHCDNTLCVNPDHLFTGTLFDNTQDMIAKGRRSDTKEQNNGNAKLTPNKVLEIRRRFKAGEMVVVLAKEFGVNPSAIYKIINKKTWKDT